MVNMTTCGSWYVGRKEKVNVRERERLEKSSHGEFARIEGQGI